jgi:hypothetical protein
VDSTGVDPRANCGTGCDCQARWFDADELVGPPINVLVGTVPEK